MSIISTITGAIVQVFGQSSKAACSIASAVATMATAAEDGASALGQLAVAAKGSATEYRSRVMETINPTDPELKAHMELDKKLRIVAHRDYAHLSFLNEDNAAPVLRTAIYTLQHAAEKQGKEPQPVEWFVRFLAKGNCRADVNELIADAYHGYMEVLAKANSVGKGSKSDTSGSGVNRTQADAEMDELLAQRQAYQSQSYGHSSDGYASQPQAQAKPLAGLDNYGGNLAPQDTGEESADPSQFASVLNTSQDAGDIAGAAEGEETGSAGSKSSSKKNQQ